jgi:stage V sporulation protein B
MNVEAGAPDGHAPESMHRGAILVTVAAAVFVASGYAVNVWVGRLLGPQDYGRFGVVIALMTVLNVVQNAAIPQAVARFVAQRPGAAHGILRRGAELQLAIAIVLAALLASVAPWIAEILGDSALSDTLRLVALVLPAYGLFTLLMAFHNGRRAYTRQALTQGAYAVAKAILAIGLAYPFKLLGAIGGYVLAPLIGILVGWQRLWAPRAPLQYGSLLAFAGPMSVYALASVAQLNVDIFFVKAMVDQPDAAGFYAAGQNISRIPYFLMTGLAVILLPAVAAAATRGHGAARSTTSRAIRAATLLVVPAAALIAATSHSLIELLYSDSYAAGADALAILAVGMGGLALSTVVASVLNGVGRAAVTAIVSLAAATGTILLCMLLIPPLGGVGAAIATTAGATACLVTLTALVARHIAGAIPVASIARIALASTAVAAAVWAIPAHGAWLLGLYAAAGVAGLGLLALLGELTLSDLSIAVAAVRRRGAA